MKKSRRTYNGVHLNKKSNTQDVVEQSLTKYLNNGKIKGKKDARGQWIIQREDLMEYVGHDNF